jgi:hypothetical protein
MLLNYKKKPDPAHQQAFEVRMRPCQKPGMAVSVVVFLVLMLPVWLAGAQNVTAPSPSATAVQHSSVVLTDEIEHLPALAWKAIPINVPRGGIVSIDLQVVRGNPIDVFLTTSDQIDNVKKVDWNNLKVYGDIKATGTKIFSRAVRLGQGGFYLVVRDMTVAIPSTPSSDISVKVRINP